MLSFEKDIAVTSRYHCLCEYLALAIAAGESGGLYNNERERIPPGLRA